MITEVELRIRGKLNYFLAKGCKVHVKKFDDEFWNGYLLERESEGVFKFMEDKFGEMTLFTFDARDVTEFKGAGR